MSHALEALKARRPRRRASRPFSGRHVALAGGAVLLLVLAACSSTPAGRTDKPLALAPKVDLPRFMGDWYVIAAIPTSFEKGAHNSKESYKLDSNGTVETTFSYRSGSFDGPKREFHSRGYMKAPSNAVWGQQYIWPIKADYRISYVAPDYSQTVITREKRDHVWIMARTPKISDADYERLVGIVEKQGYDTSLLQRMPQQAEQ